MKYNLLLLIDMQNDFCHPEGSLYVPGAEEDAKRVAAFIRNNAGQISHITMTQDNHQVKDISHPSFWVDEHGRYPEPLTRISSDDIIKGKWQARFQQDHAHQYIHKLEEQGDYPHTIWPEHCLEGSFGAAGNQQVMESVADWARDQGKFYELVRKGTNPYTEHFGALKANVPIAGEPETQLNEDLVARLRGFDRIFLAGEARTHCVAYTLRQLNAFEDIVSKITILEDGMSNIPGFEEQAEPTYKEAMTKGASLLGINEVKL